VNRFPTARIAGRRAIVLAAACMTPDLAPVFFEVVKEAKAK